MSMPGRLAGSASSRALQATAPCGRTAGRPHLHGPGPSQVPVQVPLALQDAELVRDARRVGQADRLADLPHGRRIAAFLHRLPDRAEDLALPPGQHVVGIGPVGRLRGNYGTAALRLSSRLPLDPGGAARAGRPNLYRRVAHQVITLLVQYRT